MTTTEMKLSEIRANPNNPRLIKDEKFHKLVESIRTFPEMLNLRPIVINDDNIVLGGNMRLKACKEAGLKTVPVIKASELTEEQQREFIIKDNVGFGEWDWEMLGNEWDAEKLEDWGVEVPGYDIDADKLGDGFTLPDGDKAPFQQMAFTLADEQATLVKNSIDDVKATAEYKYMETHGNENGNGNALFLIVQQWVEQRK
jgi:hypothetical protein